MSRIGQLSDHLGLEAEAREDLRAFVVEVAKQQYMIGNKAGIRWLRVQQNKGAAEASAA